LICVGTLNMLPTIQFNYEPLIRTAEIDDEGVNEMLTTEFHAKQLPIAQVSPKLLLCFCLILSKTPRSISKQR
jgi:hypothetical protein